MNKESIKRIILENQERIPELHIYDRKVSFDENANYILTGQRRAGKTFLLYFQIQYLLKHGIKNSGFLYINFEDERLLEFKVTDFDLILESFSEMFDEKPVLFFDEIQNVDGWQRYVRRLADNQYRVFVTGSNAKMLSGEMASALGGRFMVKEIETLDFHEYLSFKNIRLDKNYLYSKQRFQLSSLFTEWLYQGGFPEVLHYQDKKEYLNTIFQKVFLGDIISRYHVRNKFALNLMIKKLAESTMDEVSFSRIKNIILSTGVRVGTTTLIEYLKYLEESFLLRSAINYHKKISERETKKKYYFRDHGLLGLFLNDPESHLLETIVFNKLKRKHGNDVYYLRDKFEIDFYIPNKELIQVSFRLSSEETRSRELGALVKASRNFEVEKFSIITFDHEETINQSGIEISVIPAWKWMLASN